MRFAVARPYDRGTPGYAPRTTKSHAVEMRIDGVLAGRTMCGLDVDRLRVVKSGMDRRQDWSGITSGRCVRCQRVIDRRCSEGDEMEDLG